MNEWYKKVDALQQEINAHRPLDNHLRAQIKEYFRIGLTYSSNAIEGNTLTETETKIVLEDGITIGGKPLKDHLEAIGHSEAYNLLQSLASNQNITEANVKELHRLFYYRIDEDNAGKYRTVNAFITGSKYPLPAPAKLEQLMHDLMDCLPTMQQTMHPVEFAAQLHKEFVFIHPFIDGNGRVARLLMNLALLQAGYLIAIIPPVMRGQYINALEKAHINDQDFITLIAQMVYETQKDYLRLFAA